MNSFKQALIQLKNAWKNSLLLGAASTMFVIAVHNLPFISAFAISFGILAFQTAAQFLIEGKTKPHDIPFTRKNLFSYLIVSLILVPTSVLLGSAIGLLQSPQDFFTTAPLSLGLLILGLYFYFLFSHSLRYHLQTRENLSKAIDIIGWASIKNFRLYLSLSVYFSLLILISGMTKGVGLIVTLPLLFYTNYFSYLEIQRK